LIVLALGLFAGSVIAAQVARPLRRLEQVARRVAGGDLTAKAEPEGSREQRSLARSFNEMTGQVARLMQAQRDFVADASHQLRTPLTGLRLWLEEARATGVNPKLDRHLSAGIAEVDRLAETVNELLVLSRAGGLDGDGAELDLGELAASVTNRWRAAAGASGIELVLEANGDRMPAWAARSDLERVLDALIENALSYSPRGTTVTVSRWPGRIEVRDQGPGLAADEQDVIFERFHRGRAGRAGPPGNGLGLPIARALARRGDSAEPRGRRRRRDPLGPAQDELICERLTASEVR
jgi:signal transduction histidine kinase